MYWPGDSVLPAFVRQAVAHRDEVGWSTRIGPCRQVSSVISRLVAPW